MTDEQTIKAFEYYMNQNECRSCCPYDDDEDTNEGCTSKLVEDVLNLIKRKQAESERLEIAYNYSQENLKYWYDECKELVEELATAKSEAYKEFAERLNKNFETYTDDEEKNALYMRNLINNLAKELTEESNDERRMD